MISFLLSVYLIEKGQPSCNIFTEIYLTFLIIQLIIKKIAKKLENILVIYRKLSCRRGNNYGCYTYVHNSGYF